MAFLVDSEIRGEYWATCLRVLQSRIGQYVNNKAEAGRGCRLLRDALQGSLIVEPKISGMDNMIGAGLLCEFV